MLHVPALGASRRHRALTVRLAGALLVAANGAIHLHLYLEGYRHLALVGPLFLLDAAAAAAIALALVSVPPSWLGGACLVGALLQAGTLVALVLSLTVGLFGFTETVQAPFVGTSAAVEGAGALLLGPQALRRLRAGGGPAD